MTDQEKLAAQGKAHADLKALKSEVATLKVVLADDARWMRETAGHVSELVRNPLAETECGAVHRSLSFDISNGPSNSDISTKISELAAKTAQMNELQAQVDQF